METIAKVVIVKMMQLQTGNIYSLNDDGIFQQTIHSFQWTQLSYRFVLYEMTIYTPPPPSPHPLSSQCFSSTFQQIYDNLYYN